MSDSLADYGGRFENKPPTTLELRRGRARTRACTIPAGFEPKVVNVRWPEALEACKMANVFAVQAMPDGVVLTIGQANPPIP